MSADEIGNAGGEGFGRRKRRRRRGRRAGGAPVEAELAVAESRRAPEGRRGGPAWRGRDEGGAPVALPRSGRVPRSRLALLLPRGKVLSGAARRRKAGRAELDALGAYLDRLDDHLVAGFYSALGGQPGRVNSKERMIQLAMKAITQGGRVGGIVRSLHQRDRQALAILLQSGGIAHADEFRQELMLSLGGNEREWVKVMGTLSDRGLVGATEERDGHFFYVVPAPFVDLLLEHLYEDLALPSFDEPGVKSATETPFAPPFEFSLVTLATYIDQHPPRLTQRHDIFKGHKEELDRFFAQIWSDDSELFNFHIDFLMMHGMVELRGDRLGVNRSVLEEWLQLDDDDRKDLVFTSLERRFSLAEWVMQAIHEVGGAWVPERPLQALYRRWRRGEEWRERYRKDSWEAPKAVQREGYSFASLVNTGMVELGSWGQEKFYRLSERGRLLVEDTPPDAFTQFYLTPSFEVMAPAGLPPLMLFRIGELAELRACDRVNTYRITEVTIETALEKGWRRDDVFEFLKEHSQLGLPENVEQTLRGWMGQHGEVEYHDAMLLTVHRTQIRRLESHRKLKPFLLHRFVPGMYAVDRSRLDDLNAVLAEIGLSPARKPRKYPEDVHLAEARERLLTQVVEARESRRDELAAAHAADSDPEVLGPVPGSGAARSRQARRERESLPTRRGPKDVREVCEKAVADGHQLDMLYVTRTQERKHLRVAPERIAVTPAGAHVLVARDLSTGERLSYQLVQIERVDAVEARR